MQDRIVTPASSRSPVPPSRRYTWLWVALIVALFPVGLFIGTVGELLFANSAKFPTLSASDLTATQLCSVQTSEAGGYVLMWEIWGTPTPTPVRAGVILTPTPIATVATVSGNPERGKLLFNSIAGGCYACHSIGTSGAVSNIAPNLAGIAARAQTKKPGLSAAAYLRGVIVDPNYNIVPKTKPGVMPITYARTLSAQQIDDLVAYMLTLN